MPEDEDLEGIPMEEKHILIQDKHDLLEKDIEFF